MIEHGNILVPTDFSPSSNEALRRACVLADTFGAHVHLLHVIDPVLFIDPDLIAIPPVEEMTEALRKSAERRLGEQVRGMDTDVEIFVHVEEGSGDPSRTICSFAERLPADLIVIGRHGRQGMLEHLLIGSTAERVVRHAPCSVLVAMPHGLLAAASGEANG
ncbi:MAG: universal stress protein [Zetaproteobacteria bacterium]|nr:MAG: universal stress protein [Zetaproteobacteria bacterium]